MAGVASIGIWLNTENPQLVKAILCISSIGLLRTLFKTAACRDTRRSPFMKSYAHSKAQQNLRC